MKTTLASTDKPPIDYERPDDEHLWRALMAESDLAIGIHKLEPNGDLRVVDANASCAPFGIVDWRDAPGKLLKDTVIPDIANYVTPRLRQCIESGEPQSYVRSIDFPSGQRAWSTNLFPLKGRTGRSCYAVSVARPIPEPAGEYSLPHQLGSNYKQPADPGLIYTYDARARRLTFVGGDIRGLLGLEVDELEALVDPFESLAHPDDREALQASLDELATKGTELPGTFECRLRHADGTYRSLVFHSKLLELTETGAWHVIGIANDSKERARLEREVSDLHTELACAQLRERRLIAQELHDSVGQQITAAKLALAVANERSVSPEANEQLQSALRDVRSCLDSADREIRSLSYILHPPAIAGQKLATVLTSFATGYGGRAGLLMDVSIDTRINDHQTKLAVPLLRIFQEALSNVHRHAHATTVKVRLDVIRGVIELRIVDDGIGIANGPAGRRPREGLGLASMRERIEELGGKLTIRGKQGTRLKASIPLPS